MSNPPSLRPPRRRSPSAEVTRQRITDALLMLLENKALWEISIADITRQVGVSSQLFYAHFKNIEAVLAAHQDAILRDNPDLATLIDGEWRGDAGLQRGRDIVEAVLKFWDQHRIAMRAISMLCDQFRPDFDHFRLLRGQAAATAFSAQIKANQPLANRVELNLSGWMLLAQLHAIGETYPGMLARGTTHRAIVDTATRFMQRIIVD